VTVLIYDWTRAGVSRLVDAARRKLLFGDSVDLLVLNRYPCRRWRGGHSRLVGVLARFGGRDKREERL
jgi:hypothetical protein